jgi:hypothetical protein
LPPGQFGAGEIKLAQLPQFRLSRIFFERFYACGSGMEGGWRAFADGTDAGVLAMRV